MPRRLPWKSKAGQGDSPAANGRKATPGLSKASGSKPNGDQVTRARSSGTAAALKRPDRTPSTSPPPAPPEEVFMIDGPENDDKFRMVEDEFIEVARHFTAHLHAAEYQRLKQKAKAQNAETIRDMSRPVIGPLTEAARRRQEQRKLLAAQRRGLKKAAGKRGNSEGSGDETVEVPWRGTSLQGLMASPQRKGLPLTTLTSNAAVTRAAAGFDRSQTGVPTGSGGAPQMRKAAMVEDEETDDEEGLDAPTTSLKTKLTSRARDPTPQAGTGVKRARTDSGFFTNPRAPLPSKRSHTWERESRRQTTQAPKQPVADVSKEEDSSSSDSDPFDLTKRRKQRLEREKMEQKKAAKVDKDPDEDKPLVIPSFL